jgi:hypothetical protein
MNTRQLLAITALAFGIAGTASAQEATAWTIPSVTDSGLTRAAVAADARQALARGELHEAALITAGSRHTGTLTRAAVVESTRTALASGEVERLNAEAHRFQRPMRDASFFRVAQARR